MMGRAGWKRSLRTAALGLAAVALLGMSECGPGRTAGTDPDTLTRRQKDSLVSEMPIPGSGGVRGAMDAADQINARNSRLDSIN
jgi:hypothetical protein